MLAHTLRDQIQELYSAPLYNWTHAEHLYILYTYFTFPLLISII